MFVLDKLTLTETTLSCDIPHRGPRRKYPPNVSCPFLEEVDNINHHKSTTKHDDVVQLQGKPICL